jgi:hypothetical protein
VSASVGADFAVGCRFLTDECIAGGSEVDDAVCFGREFARAGMHGSQRLRVHAFDVRLCLYTNYCGLSISVTARSRASCGITKGSTIRA